MSGKHEIGDFGPIFRELKGKPAEAIRHLMKLKTGECPEAIYREDIGYIDFVWGRNDPETNIGYGLKHLIEKHGQEFIDIGISMDNLADIIPMVIKQGIVNKQKSNNDSLVLEHKLIRGVIKLSWHKKSKRLLLTAYSIDRSNKSLALSDKTEGVVVLPSDDQHKDTTKKVKSKLGATEILNRNSGTLYYNGFKPSYEILPSYDHLIEKADGKTVTMGDGGIDFTVTNILKITYQSSHQVAKLAKWLKGDSLVQSCFNIWHFIKHNIKYAFDDPNAEEIRSPARTWIDRFTGVDCEDYAIFSAALLMNMGYKPTFHIVNFNRDPNPKHIYTVCGDVVIDGVMERFNEHPKNITKTMKVNNLSGVNIHGLGAVAPADAVTTSLMQEQSAIIAKIKSGKATDADLNSLKKIRFMILQNGSPARNEYMELMGYVETIDDKGRFVFSNPKIKTLLTGDDKSLEGLSDNDLQEAREIAEIYEEIHESETGVFGLGKTKNERKAARQEKKADRKEAKADKKAIKEKAKEEKKAIKDKYKGKEKRENLKKVRQEKRDEMKDFREETGRGLVRNIVRYNPATILLRNGILAAMKLNMFRLAKVAKWGYLSEVAAKEKGLNLIEYQKSVKLLQKLENVFKDVGGKLENLKTAIIKGGKGEGLKGLGVEPVTAAAALTAAAGTLAAVKLFAKQLGIDSDNFGKNLFPNDKGAAADEDSIDEGDPSGLPTGDWSSEGFDSEEERDIISRNTNADDDEKKNSMWLWIGLGAAGLVTLAAVSGVFKGKKTNKK